MFLLLEMLMKHFLGVLLEKATSFSRDIVFFNVCNFIKSSFS